MFGFQNYKPQEAMFRKCNFSLCLSLRNCPGLCSRTCPVVTTRMVTVQPYLANHSFQATRAKKQMQ